MEDFDLCRKVRAVNKKVIYYPEAKSIHYHKRLSGGSVISLIINRNFWYHLTSAIKYHWKWKKD